MGKPAFFLRTFGCPVQCPWCDSAGTWHKDWIPDTIRRMQPEEIVDEILEAGMNKVVVTGGEPAIHNLTELTHACATAGIATHLETSGSFPIWGLFDWITLSPKRWKHPIEDSVKRADEFKVIVERPEDIDFYAKMLGRLGYQLLDSKPIWLHPEWSQRENPEVLKAICDAVTDGSLLFRAGWQLHKLYRVDFLDQRVMPPVPLGGDVEKGY